MVDRLLIEPLSKFYLVYLMAWNHSLHTPYIFFAESSSFRSTCPYHHNLFCCSTKIISSIPSLSLSSLLGTLSLTLMSHTCTDSHPSDHSHLCLLNASLINLVKISVRTFVHTSVCTYVHNETQCSHKPNNGVC